MASRIPPVPPSNISGKTTDKHDPAAREDAAEKIDDKAEEAKVSGHDSRQHNIEQQGQQANIKQNTTNQGYQQNR